MDLKRVQILHKRYSLDEWINGIPLLESQADKKFIPTLSQGELGILLSDDKQSILEVRVGTDPNNNQSFKDGLLLKDSNDPGWKYFLDQLNNKLDTSGGVLTGDVIIQGDLTVKGVNHTTTNVETLNVEDNLIVANSQNSSLSNLSGLAIKTGNVEASNAALSYGILYDSNSDSVKLGLGSIDSSNEFHFNDGEGLPVAIRAESQNLTNEHILKWDSSKNQIIDGGISVLDIIKNGDLKAGEGISITNNTTVSINKVTSSLIESLNISKLTQTYNDKLNLECGDSKNN